MTRRLWFGPNSNWFGDYYMDVGTGQSDVTWQAQVGLGYSFGWSDLSLSYRHLYYNPGDSTRLIENLTLYGPLLGWTFVSDEPKKLTKSPIESLAAMSTAFTGASSRQVPCSGAF